jgi:hypothetical protein
MSKPFTFKGDQSRRKPLTIGDLRDFVVRLARTIPPDTPTNVVTFDVDTTPSQPNVTFKTTNELPS